MRSIVYWHCSSCRVISYNMDLLQPYHRATGHGVSAFEHRGTRLGNEQYIETNFVALPQLLKFFNYVFDVRFHG
jgi:hypothetical protein